MSRETARQLARQIAESYANLENIPSVYYVTNRRVNSIVRNTIQELWNSPRADFAADLIERKIPNRAWMRGAADTFREGLRSKIKTSRTFQPVMRQQKNVIAFYQPKARGLNRGQVTRLVNSSVELVLNRYIRYLKAEAASIPVDRQQDLNETLRHFSTSFVKVFNSYNLVQRVANIRKARDLFRAAEIVYEHGNLKGPLEKPRRSRVTITSDDFTNELTPELVEKIETRLADTVILAHDMPEVVEEAVLRPLLGNPNIEIRDEETPSRKQRVKANIRGNDRPTRGIVESALPAVAARQRPVSRNRISRLFALLQNNLNQVVADQMGSPGLNYRTGRFARSAHIRNITGTRNNLRIGYSYQTAPYGVFEPETGDPRLATAARDPKRHIGLAIRTILSNQIKANLNLIREY